MLLKHLPRGNIKDQINEGKQNIRVRKRTKITCMNQESQNVAFQHLNSRGDRGRRWGWGLGES